jgi:septum formation protein
VEEGFPGSPTEVALGLAAAKAGAVSALHPESLVIGADTVVALDGESLGKPLSPEDACSMLRRLSGREHQVLTGVALIWPSGESSFVEVSRVEFRLLSDADISSYVATGEPMDKAGAYAIQGGAAGFVTEYVGDFDNIVGLPVSRLEAELLAHDVVSS